MGGRRGRPSAPAGEAKIRRRDLAPTPAPFSPVAAVNTRRRGEQWGCYGKAAGPPSPWRH
ncbi:unnamed protein product [Spirodela intermedia]|uniref:Uncharacterized protein n=1 Tax=Spirodela intermedia TaxID=51605 RepID=A0A7I8L1W7_SPIIN|nr:unnamed protein product [Spirodela intermedia]